MSKLLTVGNVVRFIYTKSIFDVQERECHIEKVGRSSGNGFFGPSATYIQGWDSTVRAYRTFSINKIAEPVEIGGIY